MAGGGYSLTGGFWALPRLVQTSGATALSITNATSGFTVRSTDSLSPTNWVNAPTGTNNPGTVPATLPARFYRLFKP